MIRKGLYFLGLTILIMIVSSGFNSVETETAEGFYVDKNEILEYGVASDIQTDLDESEIVVPFMGKTYVGFKEAIAFRESRGKIHLVNPFGYMGKYQFGKSTLRSVGVYDFTARTGAKLGCDQRQRQ